MIRAHDENLAEVLENEWYMVRHSGEIPEIALHASLYFLTRAKEGPYLVLTENQLAILQQAAADRFREIILRDIDCSNIGSSIYRGIARSFANFKRFLAFCERQQLDPGEIRSEVARALSGFISHEIDRVSLALRGTVFNCSIEELFEFADILDISIPADFEQLFMFASADTRQ